MRYSDRPRRALVRAACSFAGLALCAAGTGAQEVGYPPDRSPFRDLEYHQELTAYTGYFAAGRDPVGVAPQSGPMLGARYEVRVGGPAQFAARAGMVWSQRKVLDPTKPAASRAVGTLEQALYLADVGLTINLTGQKSFHRVVPVLNGGIGLVSDFRGRDAGGYQFGTGFAFSYGGGVRVVGRGPFQLRADITDYLYQIQYPDSYTTSLNSQSPVIGPGQSKGVWKHNAALTIGASILMFR